MRDDDDEPSKIQISQLLNRPASSLSLDSLLVEPNKEEDIGDDVVSSHLSAMGVVGSGGSGEYDDDDDDNDINDHDDIDGGGDNNDHMSPMFLLLLDLMTSITTDESPYAAEPMRAGSKDVHPTVPEDPVVAAIIQSADEHRTKKEKPTLKNCISELTGHTKRVEENLGRNEQRPFLPQNGSSRRTKLSAGKIKTGQETCACFSPPSQLLSLLLTGKVEVMEGDIGTWVPFAEGKWYERKDKRFSEEMRRLGPSVFLLV